MANPTPPSRGGQELPDDVEDRDYHDAVRGNGGQQDLQSDEDDEFDDDEGDEDEEQDETEEESR